MPEQFKKNDYLTPSEVAQWMKVSPITVRGWAARGSLQAEVTPGGHRRFRREEVERFIRQWHPLSNQGRTRVLIVDDDRSVLGFLREFLLESADAISVETACDGFEAGQKVLAFGPDIVLLDFMMPGIRGPEVCQRIKQMPGLANVRVIGMSGYLTPEAERAMLEAGAERCLTKPLDTDELLKLIGVEG
jgi:excisionase family DNA binding protein